MRKLIATFIIFPILMLAQEQKKEVDGNIISPMEEFVNSFYESHKDVNKMKTFFDEKYFSTYYKFEEHMVLKNKEYGQFVSLKILKARNSPDGNMIWRTYKVKYKKGSMIEKLEFSRKSADDPYKIFYWQTQR